MNRHISIIAAALGLVLATSPAFAARTAPRGVRATTARKYVGTSRPARSRAGTKLRGTRAEKRLTSARARDLVGAALQSSDQVTDKTEPFTITMSRPDK